jgi:glycerol-3-phosphate dehydrogenase
MSKPTTALPTLRPELLERLAQPRLWDVLVIGGGATGLGVALDAATRGLQVLLLERHDFAKGTSSRATKLVHGGVRYLAQGNIGLVREALHERATLLANAPHLAQPLPFVVPSYRWWELPFYGSGLVMYDGLAGKAGLGSTSFLGREQTLQALPGARKGGLLGGIRYWDGQFDDARLALALARTAALHGALLLNYCGVQSLMHDPRGRVEGARCRDAHSGREFMVQARCVINATGVWVDALREQDAAAQPGGRPAQPLVAPSQGVHLVVDRDFLGGDTALMVPKTADGRVLFAVPWLGKLILGTTDTPRHDLAEEPTPLSAEIDFILGEAGRYLQRAPKREDLRSAWVGLRPLVKPADDDGDQTKRLSREHTVLAGRSGLVTVTGGKWTTYRAMAEDVLQTCESRGLLPALPPCQTAHTPLVGCGGVATPLSQPQGWHSYGGEADQVARLPGADRELAPGLTEAMVRFAARHEYALTVEDVLARRSRWLFLDAEVARQAAPAVAALLREETGTEPGSATFQALCRQYLQVPY